MPWSNPHIVDKIGRGDVEYNIVFSFLSKNGEGYYTLSQLYPNFNMFVYNDELDNSITYLEWAC